MSPTAGPAPSPSGIDAPGGAALSRAALALAQHLARGATLWCVAPEWPEHAHHVAVEFVHPVIVGKRALPAVSVTGAGAVGTLRANASPGDVVLVIGPHPSPVAEDLLRRAPTWGVLSLRLVAGPLPNGDSGPTDLPPTIDLEEAALDSPAAAGSPTAADSPAAGSPAAVCSPPPGLADHVLWAGSTGTSARHDGSIILRYHVLWELTHVCLEHPGLLGAAFDEGDTTGDERGAADGTCITCSDDARPGEVVSALRHGLAVVRVGGHVEEVDVTLVGEVTAGDLLLVHAGTAIDRLDGDRPA